MDFQAPVLGVSRRNLRPEVEIRRELAAKLPDDPEVGLDLAATQLRAGAPEDALGTLVRLRELGSPAALDPRIAEQLHEYSQFRSAWFCDWHPAQREMLMSTRFSETSQLHFLNTPGGARRQISFRVEPLSDGAFRPGSGDAILFRQSVGGSEDDQIFLKDLATGDVLG